MVSGKTHKYGDNVNTDVIIPARYCNTVDYYELAKHCMEDIDPEFLNKVESGDILVGGENFGCGSSRETAPIAIKYSGISCVIAKSFARIFFRNAINIGLPIIESEEFVKDVTSGDEAGVNFTDNKLYNLTLNKAYKIDRMNAVVQEIIDAGGLVNYVRKYHKKA